jgi:hypothetical protein
MSTIINGNRTLTAYSTAIRQQYYMSTYYALTGDQVYIQYKNTGFNDSNVKYYLTNFNDLNDHSITSSVSSLPNQTVYHTYTKNGTYYVSFSAVNLDGSHREYITNQNFTIKNKWDIYDPNKIRLNDEINLSLPYTLEQINIQPNEWGVDDIFNTAIYRLQDSLDYLISKTQTINTFSPTIFFGWLGNFSGTSSSTIKWVTQSYNNEYLNESDSAKAEGSLFFTNITNCIELDNYLFTLDNGKLRIFENKPIPSEIIFSDSSQLSSFLINPISIDVTKLQDQYILYIADQISNNVYKLDVDIPHNNINVQLFVGGFGGLNDHSSFNNPTEVHYNNGYVYVLDYNNKGIKQYNFDLNWIHTYHIDEFETDRPISIAILNNGLLYILTEKYNIYIFDNLSNKIFEKIDISNLNDGSNLLKISFDQNNDFFFILTEQNLYKYTLSGSYVNNFIIPKTSTVMYNNIKNGKNGIILLASNNCIFKCQDILEIFKLGEGLPYQYWSKDQLKVSKNEFASDLIYNRSLIRMAQNIKTFRNTLYAKFVISSNKIMNNIITYFSYMPINVSNRPVFSNDIENEFLGVGVNELHVPTVLNKEFNKLYLALETLSKFLSIQDYFIDDSKCPDSFCWSWDAMSCYNLSLPVIKTCKNNPISFYEVNLINKGININYANSLTQPITWGNATSKCCQKVT